MYSDEQRFVWDIDALVAIANNPTVPNVLDGSLYLRRILTDNGAPLLHKVSKGRDFKARFTVNGNKVDPAFQAQIDAIASSHWRNSAPLGGSGMPTHELGLDEYLASRVCMFKGEVITVKQIINYVANVGGGVHQGTPRSKDNALLIHQTKEDFTVNGEPYPIQNLVGIIQTVVKALFPLYERLRA